MVTVKGGPRDKRLAAQKAEKNPDISSYKPKKFEKKDD